mmetsp:Transcript_6281/g.12426  ORF Transcript_6281/g.12426 Transcript_6281/m.12426 type:complete len:202 (-) Transcript_6281:1202-1807(-)
MNAAPCDHILLPCCQRGAHRECVSLFKSLGEETEHDLPLHVVGKEREPLSTSVGHTRAGVVGPLDTARHLIVYHHRLLILVPFTDDCRFPRRIHRPRHHPSWRRALALQLQDLAHRAEEPSLAVSCRVQHASSVEEVAALFEFHHQLILVDFVFRNHTPVGIHHDRTSRDGSTHRTTGRSRVSLCGTPLLSIRHRLLQLHG